MIQSPKVPWTKAEERIVKDNYILLGLKSTTRLLPGRVETAVYQRAIKLGLRKRFKNSKPIRHSAAKVHFGFSDPMMKLAVCGKRKG